MLCASVTGSALFIPISVCQTMAGHVGWPPENLAKAEGSERASKIRSLVSFISAETSTYFAKTHEKEVWRDTFKLDASAFLAVVGETTGSSEHAPLIIS